MSERKTYNLAYGKSYISGSEKKKIWVPIGRMFVETESEYGERISIRLDAIPCDPNFTGLINAFPHDPSRNGNGKNGSDNIDEIPF
jgi:hypothetical protein